MPMFDLKDAAGVLMELQNCRKTFPQHYIRLIAFDSARGVESIAMSFIVNRPVSEPGFRAHTSGGRRPHDPLPRCTATQPTGPKASGGGIGKSSSASRLAPCT